MHRTLQNMMSCMHFVPVPEILNVRQNVLIVPSLNNVNISKRKNEDLRM